ncbi:MAG: tRNA-dihydrouridine synthase [archaeon]|jgi:dihydroorotate dehydrogenase (NAD+) catalytic subunit
MSYTFLGKEISGRFTIPSGIIATNAKILLKIAKEIPQIGVITTKSIGLVEKAGNREPILHQYAPGCFVNAVGLTNPGAEEFAKQLSEIKSSIPKNRFLLISIFGSNPAEFVQVAKILEPYADGLELNLSCPHAKGYGMAIGQDPALVKEIVAAVKTAVKIPIIPKLTPNTEKLGEITKAALEAGADAICAINTIGPGYYTFDGIPILTNKKGGMSGKGVLPIGLKCIKEINDATEGKVPLIGCGGISSSQDIIEYEKAGASIFGIGSALAGMSSEEMKKYFQELAEDLQNLKNKTALGTDNSKRFLKTVDMRFKKYKLVEVHKKADDLAVLEFDKAIDIKPGQFIFVWHPECGEKPFSALDNAPLKLLVQKKGCLSEKLINLKLGDEIFVRGPHGNEIKIEKDSKVLIVGGGCGIAALYQLAKEINNHSTEVFFGARDKKHLFYIEELMKCSTVWVSTNDGSFGRKGFITELLQKRLDEIKQKNPELINKIVILNCGPDQMINAALLIEENFIPKEKIYCAIDYITKCGVGICGSCASKSGKRICVDGPFINRTEVE